MIHTHAARSRRNRPSLETLEARATLSGIPWADPGHLTLSFAPDSTPIAAHTSSLFQALDAQMARQVWQSQILRAFQTWAAYTNLNFGLTTDTGLPFGSGSKTQGEPGFGDIRIGGHEMDGDVLSVSVPYDPALPGGWAGDVLLNTASRFNTASSDLFSVALHEAGHVLGLDHSADPNSVMYSHAGIRRTRLSSSDIQAIQNLYGSRAADPLETDRKDNNNKLDSATRLRPSDDYSGAIPLLAFGEITTTSDVDYFALRPRDDYSGSMSIRLQSSGLSLLAPKLSLLDPRGRVIATGQASGVQGGLVSLRFPSVDDHDTYFLKVEAAATNEFGVGRYGLAVVSDSLNTTAASQIDALLRGGFGLMLPEEIEKLLNEPESPFEDDLHTDDTFATATDLESLPGWPANSRFEVVASLSDATDVDFYSLRSRPSQAGQPNVLTVSLSPAASNGIRPQVTLFDRNRVRVPATVLVSTSGLLTLQATGLKADSNYYLKVERPPSTGALGNYQLLVDSGHHASSIENLDSGSSLNKVSNLYVARTQLLHLALSAQSVSAPAGAFVRLEILNSANRVVFTLDARPGETVTSTSLFLKPGAYRVRVRTRGTTSPIAWTLQGINLSDPIGPSKQDPTLKPLYTVPNDPTVYSYPNGTVTVRPYLLVKR